MYGHSRLTLVAFAGALVIGLVGAGHTEPSSRVAGDTSATSRPLVLNLRTRVETKPGSGRFHAITRKTDWDPRQTAIVVCDMWDKHWCPTSTARVAEMAPRMNEVLKAARARGVLIIHCPSETMEFYKDTPQRKRAQAAPPVEKKRPLERWCRLDPQREGPLPIDDSDNGCDCDEPVKPYKAWTRQIATIEIAEEDAITDNAEAYYLMRQRDIENVIVMGVHTNMCVLGRPFSIRQLVYQGMNVALMRDMTDTMYNPARSPYVSHFTGTDLVVAHIEKHWCPTLTSVDFLGRVGSAHRNAKGRSQSSDSQPFNAGEQFGGQSPPGTEPFRFKADKRPHVVFIVAEDEYKTEESLPVFAAKHLGKEFQVSFVFGSETERDDLPGLDVVEDADVLFISVRRRVLKAEQLAAIRKAVERGTPVIGIRTASHAFAARGNAEAPEGHAVWNEFDAAILGGHYTGHHGRGPKSELAIAKGAAEHPILAGIDIATLVGHASLYKTSPLAKTARPLLIGSIPDTEPEPVTWTNEPQPGQRVFYTSLGDRKDFEQPGFNRLLLNAVRWATGLHGHRGKGAGT